MLSFNALIGLPLDKVIDILRENRFEYKVEEQVSKLEKYDTILVVQVKKEDNLITLVTDKFLLNI